MTSHSPKVFLLDGHSLVYRAHHAMSTGKGTLANAAGFPTGAIFGFLQILFRLLEKEKPSHLAVVFDPPGPSFRQEIYAEYKAHRPPQPEEIRQQFPLLKEILQELSIPLYELSPYEADDVLATLAKWAETHGGEACIVTVDKDLYQCVTPKVTILRDHLQKIEVIDEAGVVEKMGVRADQVVDYLGLLGDASDNIPGVPGIGQKRAAELLAEFGSVDAILREAEGKTKPKFWANLDEFRSQALLSVELARIKSDVPLEASWESLRWAMPSPTTRYRAILQELEFRSFLPELKGETLAERTTQYITVQTEEALQECLRQIQQAKCFSIDTETTSLDCFQAELLGISLSWGRNQAAYIPLQHPSQPCLPLKRVREALQPFLKSPDFFRIAHNWHFDFKILKLQGFDCAPISFDTMIAAYLLNPDRKSVGLKPLALEILGIQMTEFKDVMPAAGEDLFDAPEVDLKAFSDYACQDADCTFQLYERFAPELRKHSLESVFRDLELPLIEVLSSMELRGIRLDLPYFRQLLEQTQQALGDLRESIYQAAGRQLNLNSPKQLAALLFDELKLPASKKTATGYSTDVDVLESLRHAHPVPALLLQYRTLEKLRGTYIESLPSLINPRTGLIHTSYNQTIAATGRLSSSDPNLQNIPIRTAEGRAIRQGFLPTKKGWLFLAADYSQIELRLLAHYSQDPSLVEAYTTGIDIHALTASKVYRCPLESVSKEQRNAAKAINFGLMYGMSSFRLSNELGIDKREAQNFIDQYFESYAGVRHYMDDTVAFCRKHGYVETLRGRKRFIPEINSSNFNARGQAERIAINTPIQGSSADMIKIAMIRLEEKLRLGGFQSSMLLQVHDELIFEYPEEEKSALEALVITEMQSALPLRVPVVVEVAHGARWSEV
ncbi:MAG: DNA polymerase I [Candidatus Sumerlaeia bacterium]|nr:DNA polymerase I [Candidatus Sumerlaeia bacterium]